MDLAATLVNQGTAAIAASLALGRQDLAACQDFLVTAEHQVFQGSQAFQEAACLDTQDSQESAQADLAGSLDSLVCQGQAQAALVGTQATADFRVAACLATAATLEAVYQATLDTAVLVLADFQASLALVGHQVSQEAAFRVIRDTAGQA